MRKKVLFIASADLNIKSGGGYANLAYYRSLKDMKDITVDLIPFTSKLTEDINPDYYAPPKSYLRKIIDFPFGIIHRFRPWISIFLEKHGSEYDVCVINDGLKGDIIPEIKKYIKTIITIHHNCEVDFQNDNNRPTTLFGLFPYWVKRNERLSYYLSDLNLFLTQYDKNHFKEVYGTPNGNHSEVLGVFLPSTFTPISDNTAINLNNLAICGGLNNVQTINGIIDFESYFPILKEIYEDDFQLIISGRNPGKKIVDFANSDKHIRIIPNPKNMSEVLLTSGILISPVNVGSGLKLRVMDGLKMGMPILAHEVSSRGYENLFNEPWFKIYRNEKEFKNGLLDIIDYCKMNNNVRKIIIDKFMQSFSYEAGIMRFSKIISKYLNLDE